MTETASKKVNSRTAVIGPAAAAESLAGDDLTYISFEHNRLERLKGAIGAFSLLLRGPDGLRSVDCGAMVLLSAVERRPGEGQALFERLISAEPRTYARQAVAVILDRTWPADAALWRDLLKAAPRIAAAGGRIDVISRQTAVDFHDGQAAHTEARAGGVRFIRYSGALQVTETTIHLTHAIVTGPELAGEVTLEYDIIAEPARQSVPAGLGDILKQLGVFTDTEGLPVRGNLRVAPPATNIRGIFIADEDSAEDALEQARALTAAGNLSYIPEAVEIDGALCAACLTCVRICPLGAPYIGYDEELKLNRAFISYEACGGCGICAGECPADAIAIHKSRDLSA